MICNMLKDMGIEAKQNFSLKNHISFKIDSIAALAVFPENESQLCYAVKAVRESGMRFVILGNGSNLFFGDGEVQSVLIFTKALDSISIEGTRLTALAGASLGAVARGAAEESLTGLEFAHGIPGTVGGAIFMNAGAYGGAISDLLLESVALDSETGEILTLREHEFGYRYSTYMKNKSLICLGGSFLLQKGDRETIMSTMKELAATRREKQPLEYPSAGSYFKRPAGHFAGKLIEDCGLKGTRIGGAAVSEKHAGFLVNLGDATADDVLRLETLIRDEVQSRFGVCLEREVRLIR